VAVIAQVDTSKIDCPGLCNGAI